MDWVDKISQFWPHMAAGFHLLASLLASAHALLNKRDTRAATLWIAFIWLMPAVGPLLYLALGINRIRRRALMLGVHKPASRPILEDLDQPEHRRHRAPETACPRRQSGRRQTVDGGQPRAAAGQRRRGLSGHACRD